MTQLHRFLQELEKESIVTRKMLALVPVDKADWKPHPKSMALLPLATHIAELPTWIGLALNTSELDFSSFNYQPPNVPHNDALMAIFEQSLADGVHQLNNGNDAQLLDTWTLRSGDTIYSTDPKAAVIRMAISQIIHHRAQLGVYLRLLEIPIPGSYGPSADDATF